MVGRIFKWIDRLRIDEFRKTAMRKINDVKQCIPSKVLFTSHTFCPRLWERAFIAVNGNVYTCCHHMPMPPSGNIHEKTLEEIWNGKRLQMWRWLSAHGGLYCYEHCNLLSEAERKLIFNPISHKKTMPYRSLRYLTILFGEFCNIQCTMCDQDHRNPMTVGLDAIKMKIRWDHIEVINIQGGEPLAMKECKQAYLYLTEELGKKVNFLTNGTLINDEWAVHIAKGSLCTTISINATSREVHEKVMRGAHWDKVIEGIHRLRDTRDRLNSQLIVAAHFTMTEENVHQAPDFIAFANELGFDEVKFGFDNSIPSYFKKNVVLFEDLKYRMEKALEKADVKVDIFRLRLLGLIPPDFENEWTFTGVLV